MNESEFRDWARAALRSMDEKIERLAKERAQAVRAPPPTHGRLGAGMVTMVEKTLSAVKAGRVTGLAIAYVGDEGSIDGWASDGHDIHLMLIGAVQSLADDLLHPDQARLSEAATENEEAAASA